jgi:hypothetical protein
LIAIGKKPQNIKAKSRLAGAVVRRTRSQLSAMTQRQLFDLYEITLKVQRILETDLAAWMRAHPNDLGSFTKQGLVSLQLQIKRSTEQIEIAMRDDMAKKLGASSVNAKNLAATSIAEQTNELSMIFSDRMLDIETYKKLATPGKLRIDQFAKSAENYSGNLGREIRLKLQSSAVLGESFAQATARMIANFGGNPKVPTIGQLATAAQKSAHYQAERLVRTEFIAAYNGQVRDQFETLAKDDPGEEWLLKWNATDSKRTCPLCREMDEKTVKQGKKFASPRGPISGPPLHPNCRCSAYPFQARWKIDEGVNENERSDRPGRRDRSNGPAKNQVRAGKADQRLGANVRKKAR